MEKKKYVIPQSVVVEISVQRLMTVSQFDAPVNDPSEEVNAEEALSRTHRKSVWD
jgi:hypothetical protein